MLARCEQVCAIVEGMRHEIIANSFDESRKEGMLIGGVDTYLSSFDSQVSKMRAQLALSREHWMARSRASSDNMKREVNALLEISNSFD